MILFLCIVICLVQWGAGCDVSAKTTAGWVCGVKRLADGGAEYASFRGVPYAKQPLGKLRFKELQPPEKWKGCFNATLEGPVCPFHDVFYGKLMQPQGVSEACIHANIHVPIESLPRSNKTSDKVHRLPILVYIHGGGWVCGSGDADFNGPEYLVSKGVIVITFNYRLDVFGFLSLNTTKIPGNNGLRDMITLLRWVQANARHFGGNPDDVTLAGQSAGASSAHILSLSPAAAGLFKRVWLMSGTGIASFLTINSVFSQELTTSYLSILGIESLDSDEIYDTLVKLPLETLHNASEILLNEKGFTTFVPVVESPLPNVTPILTDDPANLIANGIGNNITLIIGFTSAECETFRPRMEAIDIVSRFENTPLTAASPHMLNTESPNTAQTILEKLSARYFNGTPTLENIIKMCSESNFIYPAIRLARARAATGGAPVYLYKFAYDTVNGVFKKAFNLSYSGAGHSEDLNYILKVNSLKVPKTSCDESMKDWMTDFMINYMLYGKPARYSYNDGWPAVNTCLLQYQDIRVPQKFIYSPLTDYELDMVDFYDSLAEV